MNARSWDIDTKILSDKMSSICRRKAPRRKVGATIPKKPVAMDGKSRKSAGYYGLTKEGPVR